MFEKKRGKRFLASVMALVMLLSLAPVGALATEGEDQQENTAVTLPANGDDQKPVMTDEENTENTNEETTPPPPANKGIAALPANNNNTSVALPETPVIVKPAEGLIDEASGVDADTSDNGIADYKGGGPGGGNQGKSVEQPEAVTSITAEYWVTNSRVTAGGKTSLTIDTTDSRIVNETGASVESLAPATGKQNDNTAIFWQARVLPSDKHQTNGAGINSTGEGQKIQKIRYNDSKFQYQVENSSDWEAFNTDKNNGDQLVFYYLIKTNFAEGVQINISDWPETNSPKPRDWWYSHNYREVQYKLHLLDENGSYVKELGTTHTWYYDEVKVSDIQVTMNDLRQYYIEKIDIDGTEIAVENNEATFPLDTNGNKGVDHPTFTVNIYVKPCNYLVTYIVDGQKYKEESYKMGTQVAQIAKPQKNGYTFTGWTIDEENKDLDITNGNFTMPKCNVTFYGTFTQQTKYGVTYEYVSGTAGKELPAEISVSKGAYAVSDNTKYYAGETVNRQTKPVAGTKYEETDKDTAIVTGTWTLSWDKENATMTREGVTFTGTWTYQAANQYSVTYRYVSGTEGKPLPAEISVSKGAYAVSDNTKYYAGETVNRQTKPVAGTKYEETDKDTAIVTGTWTLSWDKENATMTREGVTFTGTWTYQAAPEPGKWAYTINQNFINAKGEKTTQPVIQEVPDTTKQTLQASIPAEMQKNQSFGNPAQNYLYIATETKYHVNSAEKNATDNLANGAVIDLYYYLDVIGDKDEKGNDKGDKIPDCYQVTIIYKSSDESRGKISDASPKKEVLTITDKDGNRLSSGKVEITGASAEVTGSSCYFSSWTNDAKVETSTAGAILGKQTIKNAKGGDVYTFTANFDRSSGGGSGGSNRPKPPVVEIPDDVPTGLNGKDHYAYIIGYGNNDVRPQNNITRAEVATIFFRLLTDETRTANMTKSNSYNDVKDGDWFCCAVSTLSKMGIIKGYEDGSFKPNDPISRAEFAAIAARFDPDGDKTPATFADVTSHWAKDEISIAANHGWIKGYEDGSFKPDQKITRAETMTLVNRVLNRLPETKDDLHKDMKTWVDNMDETAWYYLAVQEATNSHYFKNKTSTKFEQWTDLRDTRDWSELEK